MPIADLFQDEDYRHRLTLGRGEPTAFFAPGKNHDQILAERRHWLATAPEQHLAELPEAGPLIAETLRLVRDWGHASAGDLAGLGAALEPDFVLLKADATGVWRLVAGCVCFPTVWGLDEKIGRTLVETHAPVPGLNSELAAPIHSLFSKLRPGVGWLRSNWGISSSAALNQHPVRRPPRLTPAFDLAHIWLRVERQILVALPDSGGILFGIRIENHPLADVLADTSTAAKLARSLRTMPDAMLEYKGLADVRDALVAKALQNEG